MLIPPLEGKPERQCIFIDVQCENMNGQVSTLNVNAKTLMLPTFMKYELVVIHPWTSKLKSMGHP